MKQPARSRLHEEGIDDRTDDELPQDMPPAAWPMYTRRQHWRFLAVLFLVSTSSYLDRNIIAIVLEPIKLEFGVSDTMLGLLSGFSFAIFYTAFGLPVARWADRGNRRTIITLALSIWSLMTVLSGMAQSFWQLVLARVGVGAGESGAIPPGQSLIIDYFPPERRATALAIFGSAAVAGSVLGFGVGGYFAAFYGWRSALILAGAPGLLLALIAWLALDEPRTKLGFAPRRESAEGLSESLGKLWHKRSYLFVLAGSIVSFLVSYGPFTFVPAYLTRVLQVPLARVSIAYGAGVAVASLIGTICGGWLADRLGRNDRRWLAWLGAAAYTLSGPFYIAAFCVDDFRWFMVLAFMGYALITAGTSIYAATHAICGSRRRALAVSLILFGGTLIGGGFGPLVTGALSDALSARYGADGLRYSLMSMMTLLFASGALFYLFGRAMPRDLED